MRKKLLLALQDFTESVGYEAVPPDSTKLSDLIIFIQDTLAKILTRQLERLYNVCAYTSYSNRLDPIIGREKRESLPLKIVDKI